MKIPMRIEHEGMFIAEVSGGERGTIKYPGTFNMILDVGIERLTNVGSSVLEYISVGTGNSPPHPSQSALDQRVATTDRNGTKSHSYVSGDHLTEAYGQTTFSVQFARGVAAANLTEVAVGWTSNGSANWSRALFRDSFGNPTTITVRADEFLRVTYILRRYLPSGWIGTLTYDDDGAPASSTVTITPSTSTSQSGNGSAGAVRAGLSVSGATSVSYLESPAFNQVKWRVFYDLDYGNPQIAAINISTSGSGPSLIPAGTNITFSPPIPKTNEFDVSLEFILTVARRAA